MPSHLSVLDSIAKSKPQGPLNLHVALLVRAIVSQAELGCHIDLCVVKSRIVINMEFVV
jgi:hypothetical protein